MKFTTLAAAAMLFAAATSLRAEDPGKHPYYLHALSDLRAARWNIEQGHKRHGLTRNEDFALGEIDSVIADVKKAAIDDGKDINEHPPVDEKLDRRGRLHRALQLLKKTRSDIAREEDDSSARGLKRRSLRHLDSAIRYARRAVNAA